MFKTLTARKQIPADAALTIRFAAPADEPALSRLAQLDSSETPTGDVLVAEVGHELWAALSLDDGRAVSDPFHPSAEALLMVAERARGLRRGHERRYRRVRPRFA